VEDHVPTGKTYKSFQYSNNLVWDTARRGRTSAPGKPDIEIGSPPEFKGEAGVWAPEEMLVAALNACMMLTFVSFAQSKRLAFVAYESTAEGLLENVDGKYRIVEVSVRPTLVLRTEADIATARTIMAEVNLQLDHRGREIGSAISNGVRCCQLAWPSAAGRQNPGRATIAAATSSSTMQTSRAAS
jgi:organic hydroperoxide reductase OsmC/OhrA